MFTQRIDTATSRPLEASKRARHRPVRTLLTGSVFVALMAPVMLVYWTLFALAMLVADVGQIVRALPGTVRDILSHAADVTRGTHA